MLGHERSVTRDVVGTDAQHRYAVLLERRPVVAETARLAGAARRVILGVKIHHHRLAAQRVEPYLGTVLVQQPKIRRFLSYFNHNDRSILHLVQILVVEDDDQIARYVCKGLTEAGYAVERTETGEDALGQAALGEFDALVVDVALPGKDGLWLIENLRGRGVATPVLVLSARGSVDDRVRGLKHGADDYMTKPFSFTELLARIEALLRRAGIQPSTATGPRSTTLALGDLRLDLLSRDCVRAGRPIDLQPREYGLLEYFMRNPAQVLTKTMILEHVWNYDFDPQTNVVDVLVSRLRAKIDRDFTPKVIHTLRGVGYAFYPEGKR